MSRWRRSSQRVDEEPAQLPAPEDDLGRFAEDLRALRAAAGNPTLSALERQIGISKSVLSDAFAGRALPTERTVQAVVAASGADPQEWLRRRQALDAGARPARPAAPAARPVVGRRSAILAAVGAFVVGAALAAGGTWLAVGGDDAEAGPRVVVQPGTDPATTPCVDDAVVTASATRALQTQLQIIYSESCRAAWVRITRYDGKATGNEVSASIFRQIAPTAADRQDTTEPDAQSAYSTLIVRPTASTRLCATGSLTVDGQQIDLGDPICM